MRRISRNRFLQQCACLLYGTTTVGLSIAVAEDVELDLKVRCLSAACSGGKLTTRIRVVNRSAFSVQFLARQLTCPLEDCVLEVVDKDGKILFKEIGHVEDGAGPSELVRLPPRGFFETTVVRRVEGDAPNFRSTEDAEHESTLFIRVSIKAGKGTGIRGVADSDEVIRTTPQRFLSTKLPVSTAK